MATLRPERTTGWPAFFAWSLCGGLLSFSFLSFAGLFTLPLGFILFGLLMAFAPDRNDRWGFLAGVGTLLILIGLLNLNSSPCPEQGWVAVSGDGSYSCGGLDAQPWLIVGALIVATAVFLYRRRLRTASSGGLAGGHS